MSSIAIRTSRLALAALAAGSLALTGCAGSPGANGSTTTASASRSEAPPSASDSASEPPRPATSTSPAQNVPAPELPDATKDFSKEGFRAFADYWFRVQNYALETGDTAPLAAISSDACELCEARIENAKLVNKDGGWGVGGSIQVESFFSHLTKDSSNRYLAVIKARQGAGQFFNSDGSSSDIRSFEASEIHLNFYGTYSKESGWTAYALTPIE